MTAIDIAEPMLEKARERAEQAGVDVTFDLGDVEYLPYEDACVRRRRRRTSASIFAPGPRERRRRARARTCARRAPRVHRVEAEPEARRALPPLHRGADRGPRGLRMGPRGPRRGHARRGLRARVRGRHALARGRVRRGDLEALLGVGAAGDRAAQAARAPTAPRSSIARSSSSTRATARRKGGIRAPRRYLLVLGTRK